MKAIYTEYFGPTNYCGSRIKASDGDGHTITISVEAEWNHETAHNEAAIALCRKMKWSGPLMRGEVKIAGKIRCVYTFDAPGNRVTWKEI